MGLHLYCIVSADHAPAAGLEGVGGAPVRRLDIPPVAAWVSDLDRRPAPGERELRTHDEVVWAAASAATALPARFGQWFESATAAADAIRDRSGDYEGALAELRGALEFGVRILGRAEPTPARPGTASGRAYLEALARRHALARRIRERALEAARALERELGSLVRRQRLEAGDDRRGVDVAHLVRCGEAGAYRTAVHRFGRTVPELDLRMTGPWPPYSFVP